MPSAPNPSRLPLFAWILLAVAATWAGWNTVARATRITQVTDLPEWSVDAPALDPASATGYEHGWRRLVLPEHNYASFLWITQAQMQLADGQWRMRQIAFENAPAGRPSHLSSPYAWWLAGLAWADHAVTGKPAGLCVERAALYADPLLLALFAGLGFVAAWRWLDAPAAVVVVLGLLTWFPLNGNFVPGAPDRAGLWLGVNLLAALALVSACRAEGAAARRRFLAAGALHGLGLWLDAVPQAAIIAGFCAGGLVQGLLARRTPDSAMPALDAGLWRGWALTGALVSLTGYLVEYAPAGFDLRLAANHPLYALAWMGLAEIVALVGAPAGSRGRQSWLRLGVALAAVLTLPVLVARSADPLPWQLNAEAARLSVVHAVNAENFLAWLRRDGPGLALIATLLPVVLAGVVLASRRARESGAAVVLLGPVVFIGLLALWQLSWWSSLQVCLLAAIVAALPRGADFWWGWAVAAAGLCGLIALSPARSRGGNLTLNESELAGLIERDLAHRLSRQVPVGVVLAPPATTAALHYYGGLAGLGTFAWENQAGLTAAARIASASSPDEAAELVRGRNVTHLVMPSWDDFLDEYAGLGRAAKTGAPVASNSFVAALHRWEPPLWLRPRGYAVPAVNGLEGQTVVLFEVTDPQDSPTAMSRMADYFLETGRMDYAAMTRKSLAGFPAHLGALAASAKVAAAQGDGAAFAETVDRILPLLAAKADRSLAWDRRVTLAVVLFSAKQTELARAQVQRCLKDASAERVHSLGAQANLQFLLLAKRLGMAWPAPELERLAVSLLPPESRARLQ